MRSNVVIHTKESNNERVYVGAVDGSFELKLQNIEGVLHTSVLFGTPTPKQLTEAESWAHVHGWV